MQFTLRHRLEVMPSLRLHGLEIGRSEYQSKNDIRLRVVRLHHLTADSNNGFGGDRLRCNLAWIRLIELSQG